MTHFWVRCMSPVMCLWESPCFTSRGPAAAGAGAHKRKHELEILAPGVRASVRIYQHSPGRTARGGCGASAVSA